MDFWHGFWIITGVHFLACMSPGPDFVLVSQQSLGRGRAAGLLTALGIALGFGVHIVYSVFGLVTLVAQSAPLLTAVKIIGGLYLWSISAIRASAPKSAAVCWKSERRKPRANRLAKPCGAACCAMC